MSGVPRARAEGPWSTRRRRLVGAWSTLRTAGAGNLLWWRRLQAQELRLEAGRSRAVAEEMWRNAAAELGANVRQLSPALLEVRAGSTTARISGLATTQLADRVSGELALDKPLVLALLAEEGLPIPEHVCMQAGDLEAARAFLERAGGPVVLKPAHGQGGAGVVGHVSTPAQLAAALTSVGRYGPRLLLERQVAGDSYRVLLLDGVLLDVVRRQPPRVRGDGVSTVASLVRAEAERRLAAGGDACGYKPYGIDLDCLTTLASAGLAPGSVPAPGEEVVVRTATNYGGPELSWTALGELCPAAVESARRAAAVVGMRLAGVDIVTAAPERPLEEAGGVILEVNAPALRHHYNVADRAQATRVAVPILAALLGLDVSKATGRGPVGPPSDPGPRAAG